MTMRMEEEGQHTVVEMESLDTDKLVASAERERQYYLSSLSSRQMESLVALCDSFVPSINVSDYNVFDDSVATFFQTSASMAGTPQRLGGLISERLKHPKLMLVRLTLWVLSTWIGTLILCGRACLSTRFPYVHSFPRLPQHRREQILLSWSQSFFSLLRMLFTSMKFLSLLVFFTQVDDRNDNQSWKAIGYCGPDPKSKYASTRTECQQTSSIDKKENTETTSSFDNLLGPLYRGLVDLKQPQEKYIQSLIQSGFQVKTRRQLKGKQNLLPPPPRSPSRNHHHPYMTISCDAVIVGSGSGAGVVAGVLANEGYKVLVLEKGSYMARKNLSLLEGESMDQMYLGSGLLATQDMGVLILAASTVGGGSTINWSASIRTPQHVMREWCETHELELFGSKLYREALDAVCKKMGVQSEISDEGFNNMVLRKGCQECGYPLNDIPRNAPPDHYCGWCCFGCRDGRKKGTSETWLVDLVNSGNGAIIPECEALKVIHKKGKGRSRSRASGVCFEFFHKGRREICVVESKVTIVGCGALATPSFLKKSGLKNKNIGKNLHLHPVTMAWGYFPDNNMGGEGEEIWPEFKKKSYEGGIMTAMSTVVGNFEDSGYGAVIQTPALHPGMFSILMPWISGIDLKMRMCKYSRIAHVFALARDKGSGELVSPNNISYKMDRIDEENLKKGLEKVLRILAMAGAEEIGTHHCEGKVLNVKKVSSHQFERFVKEESSRGLRDLKTPICSAHQMGSCRMGVDPKNSAVNPMGETWEVEGLYVADSSVFPTALGVNPMVTIQAISYCTAQSILEVLRRKKGLIMN